MNIVEKYPNFRGYQSLPHKEFLEIFEVKKGLNLVFLRDKENPDLYHYKNIPVQIY